MKYTGSQKATLSHCLVDLSLNVTIISINWGEILLESNLLQEELIKCCPFPMIGIKITVSLPLTQVRFLNLLDVLGFFELMIVDREVYVKVNYNNGGCRMDRVKYTRSCEEQTSK